MKNRIIIMAASIAALTLSCQKEEIPTPVVKTEPMVIATGVDTKTILVNQKDILWTPGDKIMVLDNQGNKSEFEDKNLTTNSASANFAGSVTDGTTKFMAVYPSNCVTGNSTYEETVVTIPDVQTPKVGSFATGHNISVAYGEKTPGTPNVGDVVFENIGGLLKFSLPTDLTNIASVSISSTSDIAGSVKVSSSDDGICTTFTGGAKTITMNPGSGKTFTFEDGKVNTFWFALAPVSLNDITISVSTDKGYTYSMKKEWDKPVVIEAGKFQNLGTLVMKQATVVAEHTTNSMGQLNGTKLDITLPDDAKDIVLNLKNTQDTVWAKITSLNVKGAETYTSYPYLPKGTYQLSGTYTIKSNGTKVTLGTTIVTVPAPTFSVTPAKARTTYTVATSTESWGGIDNANKLTKPLEITNLKDGVVPGITEDILNKYPELIGGITTKIQNNSTSIETSAASYDFFTEYIQKLSSNWYDATTMSDRLNAYNNILGVNRVISAYTFDNTTCESTAVDYFITGLPYTLDYSANDGGWAESTFGSWGVDIASEVKWNNNSGVRIGENASGSSTLTRNFYTPNDRNVVVSVSGFTNSYVTMDISWSGIKFFCDTNTGTISLGGVPIFSSTVDSNDSFTRDDVKSGKSEDLSPNKAVTTQLKSNNPVIMFSNSKSGMFRYLHIKQFSIKYAM